MNDASMANHSALHTSPWNATALATWENVEQSCTTYKTCDSCLNASYFCHFCEKDFQCHAIGSPSGCLVGISTCHHLEDCERKQPQHVGYGPPPSVVLAVLCIMVTLTCCLCGISAICSVFVRSKQRREEKRNGGSLRLATVDEQLSPTQTEPLLTDSSTVIYEDDVDNENIARLQHQQRNGETVSMRRVLYRVFWIGLLIGTTAIMLMFYPRMPDYDVCNREFEWDSILHSLIHIGPKIEYNVLISAINENRFGFVLEQGMADIYHNETWVGYWRLNQSWEAQAGAISDVIAPIILEPPLSEAYSLLSDFRSNNLVFRINASITGYITWGSYNLYRISSSVPDIEFLVGAEYDRGLCKCTEYLEPQ